MKKTLVSLLLVAAMLVCFCVPSMAEGEPVKIAVAHITMYDEWCKAVYDEFNAQCAERGWEVTVADGNLNAETQQKQVEDFIAQGDYTAICIDPVNSDGIIPTLEQAGEKGIPVFAFDSGTAYEGLITHVAWDHAETGDLTAEWVANYAKENLGGKVKVGVLAMLNAVHTQVRSEHFVAKLEELLGAENITWVFNQDFGETRESAANIVTNNIMKPIDVIWGAVDNAAIGAASALDQNGTAGTIVVSAGGWGSEPFNKINDDDPYYKMCIGVSAANIVRLTLDSIQRYLDGDTEIPREQNIQLAVIDGSNIADYMQYVQ